jgi:hypothetical protein
MAKKPRIPRLLRAQHEKLAHLSGKIAGTYLATASRTIWVALGELRAPEAHRPGETPSARGGASSPVRQNCR